ncbi:serine hydrolase [Sphingomonas koreensis]|nr:serine hydrolase [Sphingomonas koreensis]
MREALAALALLAAAPALAQAAPPPATAVPAPMLKTRLDQLVALLNGKAGYATLFSPSFRQAVPRAQLQSFVAGRKAQGGLATGVASIDAVTPWQATVKIAYQRVVATFQIAIDPAAPHLITGLRSTGAAPQGDSIAKLDADFRKLPGASGFGIYALSDQGVTPFAQLNGETAAPLASGFKLWVLAEAVRQINAGERHWDDVVRVGRHSLPSGILQTWPGDAPVTLQTLATLMISISDNTAADTLLTTLGRDNVDQVVKTLGVADPARTLPVLTTGEAFALKTPANAALAGRWATATPEARLALLKDNTDKLTSQPLDPAMFGAKPLAIDSVEWFASPADMARTLNWLRQHGDATMRDILSVTPKTDPANARQFGFIGFKGGSEPGVITMSFLIETKTGAWFAVTGNWHNAAAAVDEAAFGGLMNRALALAAR